MSLDLGVAEESLLIFAHVVIVVVHSIGTEADHWFQSLVLDEIVHVQARHVHFFVLLAAVATHVIFIGVVTVLPFLH